MSSIVTVRLAADGVVTATCSGCPDDTLTADDNGTWEPPEVTAYRSRHTHTGDTP